MKIEIETNMGTFRYDGRNWTGNGTAAGTQIADVLNSRGLPEGGPHDSTADLCMRLARNLGLEPSLASVEGMNEDVGEDVSAGEGN